MEQLSKHPLVYSDDTIDIYIEVFEEKPFIHCTVHKWGRESYFHILNIWVELLDALSEKGYTEIYAFSDNKKLNRFASMFGFEESEGLIQSSDGKIKEVLICQQH